MGNPIRGVDLYHVVAADSSGGHLSGWIERWVGHTLAIHLHANCLERAEANPLDVGIDGCDQRDHGHINCLCVGSL